MYHGSSSDPLLWDEVKQLRKEMMEKIKQLENEMKQLRNDVNTPTKESRVKPDNIRSVRHVYIPLYLNELRKLASESSFVKIVWLLVIVGGLILMTYQITEIAKDYANEVTVTQMSQIETNLTELNRPSICFSIFPDLLYTQADGGSSDDVEPLDNDSLLYMGYIKAMIPHFASSGLWLSHVPPENITWSQFQSLEARPWYSLRKENASLLSQNTLYDSLYDWGIGQFKAEQDSELLSSRDSESRSKFSHAPNFYSDILSRFQSLDGTIQYYKEKSSICVPINVSNFNFLTPSGERSKWFTYSHYFGEPAKLKILHEMEIDVMYYNAQHFPLDLYYGWSTLETDLVYKHDTVNYIILPIKYQHQNLSRRKCHDANGEIYPRGYAENICFHDCLWEHHTRLFNCSFWEDFNDYPSMKVCHIFDIFHQIRSYMSEICSSDEGRVWCNNETSYSVDEWNGLVLEMYVDRVINETHQFGCKEKCAGWMFCDEWELEYGFLYKHEIVKQPKPDSNWSGLVIYREYTISNFVSVNKEVLKASLEEFMASLGGTIGLYFGFTLCGCSHLLLFLSAYGVRRLVEPRKKSSQVDDHQQSTIDTQGNSRDIRMVEMD